jgi:peptidoglycan/LPS O-acetylase OafA/YrhL
MSSRQIEGSSGLTDQTERRPSSAEQSPTRRITALDGWRGVSILLVIAGHLINYRYARGTDDDLGFRLLEVLSTAGVCIFFAISGFIIVRLAIEERERSGAFSAAAFYVRRCFRILPPLWVYLAVVLLLSAAGWIAQARDQTLIAGVFVCNLPGLYCGRFANHTWSLAYEEQFYLLLPLLMWKMPRRTFPILLMLLLSVPVIRYLTHPGHVGTLIAFAAFFFSFICAGGTLAAHRDAMARFARTPFGARAWILAIALALGLCLIDALGQGPGAGSALHRARALLVPTLEPIVVAWLVASTAVQSSALTRVLDWAPLNFIGVISFSLYLWQSLFTNLPQVYLAKSPLLFPPLMFVCAALSYWLIERPFVSLGKRVLKHPRTRPFAPAPSTTS